MGLQISRSEGVDSINVFQKVLEDVAGGAVITSSELPSGGYIEAGAFVYFNPSTRVAKVVKTAKLYAGAGNTDVEYQVPKGHAFKVGDYISHTVGGTAYAITEIDDSNDNYDVLTVGTTLGETLTEGDVLYESGATGASAGAYKYTASGILKNGFKVAANTAISIVVRGTVLEGNLPYGVTDAIKTALTSRVRFA